LTNGTKSENEFMTRDRSRGWKANRLWPLLAVLLPAAALISLSCSEKEQPFTTNAPVSSYRVITSYPHDPQAYTEGLVYDDGVFYESTGLRGRSSLRKVALETGEVLQIRELSNQYFGEGIALLDSEIVQLTWQLHVGFVCDKETFAVQREFHYPTEGWGMTYDGERIIMSDGTPVLYFLDPVTLERTGRLRVTDEGRPVTRLNELEWVKGEIYANIWLTNRIVRIDPQTGDVLGWIDLTDITENAPPVQDEYALPNGIAYDSLSSRLFVTGKLWPRVYQIELVPKGSTP
jgi:glutamine cyclotransferase